MKHKTLHAKKSGEVETIRGRLLMWKNLVVSLYMKGHNIEQIRELAELETGHRFSGPGVYSYLAEAIKGWESNKEHFQNNHKAIELEKVNRLEVAYWEGFERSKKIQRTKVKTKGGEDGGKLAISQVREEDKKAAGDPRFLNGIQWCIDRRCSLLGIDAPQLPPLQVNTQVNNDNRTIINRRVVFKTRETTTAQILPEVQE
jgi:hypothetical protein